jgi:O-antigen ligase
MSPASSASRHHRRSSNSRRRKPLVAKPPPGPGITVAAIGRGGIVSLTLLALLLGGTTELWEQTLVLALGALLILIAPPPISRGPVPWILGAALLLLALAAFLPAAWFPVPPWKANLAGSDAIVLPSTRTPQPWLTAQACAFLFAGLVWALYALNQGWDRVSRPRAAQVLIVGVGVLAAAMTATFCLGFHVPYWNQEQNRGWFPNRNQTADVLGACAVVNYALLFGALRKRRLSAYAWIATLLAIGAALIVSFSRAGILMFFAGIALWHIWPIQSRGGGRARRPSLKWTTLGLAAIFMLLAGFFLLGGDTLARFEGQFGSAEDSRFRLAIQEDALRFSTEAPVLGVGLGNFEPLFASTQRDSANEDRAIHPESDWLWAICELGWFAPVLFVAGIAWWLRRCLPFRPKPGESLRRAAFVGAILFLLHGLVDVSGHRLGSLWVGLLLAGLALPKNATMLAGTAVVPPDRGPAWLFRGLALGIVLITGWWSASLGGQDVPPTTETLAKIQDGITQAVKDGRMEDTLSLADAGLAIAPVNWRLHFQRGYAEAFIRGRLEQAGADFLAARKLEAKWLGPTLDEGAVWLSADEPDQCLDAWAETLRRAGPDHRAASYRQMLEMLRDGHETVRDGLRAMAAGQLDLQLVFLDFAASPDEFMPILNAVLTEAPDLQRLSPAQRTQLFRDWWNHGDRAQLLAAFQAHPGWLADGWPFLAQSYADQADYQHAWGTVASYAPAPSVPTSDADAPRDDLEREFHDQQNAAAGVMLYLAQDRQGDIDGALGTARALEKLKDCPKYIYYEEARLWASKQQWDLAWEAWQNFSRP